MATPKVHAPSAYMAGIPGGSERNDDPQTSSNQNLLLLQVLTLPPSIRHRRSLRSPQATLSSQIIHLQEDCSVNPALDMRHRKSPL